MIDVLITTDDYHLAFRVLLSKDYIDTDRGVKVERYAEAHDLQVYTLDTHELLQLIREEHEQLFEKYAEQAEEKALAQL